MAESIKFFQGEPQALIMQGNKGRPCKKGDNTYWFVYPEGEEHFQSGIIMFSTPRLNSILEDKAKRGSLLEITQQGKDDWDVQYIKDIKIPYKKYNAGSGNSNDVPPPREGVSQPVGDSIGKAIARTASNVANKPTEEYWDNRNDSIIRQCCIKAACDLRSGSKTTAKKVLSDAEEFYDWITATPSSDEPETEDVEESVADEELRTIPDDTASGEIGEMTEDTFTKATGALRSLALQNEKSGEESRAFIGEYINAKALEFVEYDVPMFEPVDESDRKSALRSMGEPFGLSLVQSATGDMF